MRKYPTTIAFTIMMMVMILLTGCATDTISVGVRDTPTPELVEGPVRVVPAAPPSVVTLQPSGTVVPAPRYLKHARACSLQRMMTGPSCKRLRTITCTPASVPSQTTTVPSGRQRISARQSPQARSQKLPCSSRPGNTCFLHQPTVSIPQIPRPGTGHGTTWTHTLAG